LWESDLREGLSSEALTINPNTEIDLVSISFDPGPGAAWLLESLYAYPTGPEHT
jgi:hypothetical protein